MTSNRLSFKYDPTSHFVTDFLRDGEWSMDFIDNLEYEDQRVILGAIYAWHDDRRDDIDFHIPTNCKHKVLIQLYAIRLEIGIIERHLMAELHNLERLAARVEAEDKAKISNAGLAVGDHVIALDELIEHHDPVLGSRYVRSMYMPVPENYICDRNSRLIIMHVDRDDGLIGVCTLSKTGKVRNPWKIDPDVRLVRPIRVEKLFKCKTKKCTWVDRLIYARMKDGVEHCPSCGIALL